MPAKKTEILFGFGPHLLNLVEKKLPHRNNADIIVIEAPQEVVDKFIKGKKKLTESELADYTPFPEESIKDLYQLRKLSKEGKTILGFGGFHSPEEWTKGERNRLFVLQENLSEHYLNGDVESYARARVELNRLLEGKAAEWIKSNLPNWKGKKIFIDMGAGHAPLYHMLKRDLKGISVRAEYLTKRMYEERGILHKKKPLDQIINILTYRTPSAKNPEKIKELVRQQHEFDNEKKRLEARYQFKERMTPESASERAEFELLRRQTRRGLRR